MISILVLLGILMALTLPMALGYVGLIAMALAGVFYGALYAINYGFQALASGERPEAPWRHHQDKAS